MARKNAVWGIDIGVCAIKAMRCYPGNAPGELIADKYDYIEFPKMLNQPEVDAEEQIQDALKQFLSRNEIIGDRVAVSVPGQSGLSRFFRPPPVDQKTLPDIVKYEVKQQIPFPIEDVIWDWQKLGGVEVDGRLIDAEVGLFAMKRDGVFRALKPFNDAGISVDIVQLSPLAIYNFACHEIFKRTVGKETAELDTSEGGGAKSVVVMSMGTDTTDLIVTNGARLWLRNIPVGGNHFTKQLSRELKLTHAKAEQLKKNLRQTEDPRQLLQAMRPVFNDLVNEVQRSITFFRSLDKTADINQMVLLGNTAQLPGLRQYLGSQLEIDMSKVDGFHRLSGPGVVDQAPFQENMLSFAPAYGLCLQASNQGRMKTNLLPREIQVERIVEAKKPWILSAVSFLMLGAAVGLLFASTAWYQVSDDYSSDGKTWAASTREVETSVNRSKSLVSTDEDQKIKLANILKISEELTSSSSEKTTWIELYSAIGQWLPKDPRIGNAPVDPKEVPFLDRKTIYIDYIETAFFNDLTQWEVLAQPIHSKMVMDANKKPEPTEAAAGEAMAAAAVPAVDPNAVPVDPSASGTSTLVGSGWVVEIRAHHFHNSSEEFRRQMGGYEYVIKSFIQNMEFNEITLPGDEAEGGGKFMLMDLGVFLPTIIAANDDKRDVMISWDPSSDGSDGEAADTGAEGNAPKQASVGAGGLQDENKLLTGSKENSQKASRFDFAVHFAWQPKTAPERVAARKKRMDAENEKLAAAQAAAQAAAASAAPPTQ